MSFSLGQMSLISAILQRVCALILVILPDKILKTDCDVAGGGAQVVAGAEGAEDFIPTNRWLRTVDLSSRIAFMSVPRSRGRSPRQGHKEGAREPMRFYQQIKDKEDLAMLVVPPKFVEVMNTLLVIKRLPHVVRLSRTSGACSGCRSSTSRSTWCLVGAGTTSAAATGSSTATSSLCASQDSD